MVRMSDLVRGDKAGSPTATPATPPAAPRSTATPAAEPQAAPPSRALSFSSLANTPAETPAPPPAVPVPRPRDIGSAEDIFTGLQVCLDRVRVMVKPGEPLPWDELQRLVEQAIESLAAAGDLFWLAHDPKMLSGVDALAVHQARVAVMALRIGISVGLDQERLVELGLAGALVDVGLWTAGDGSRRLDPQSAEYRTHSRLSAEFLARSSPPSAAIVMAVLQHHELEHGQGFPAGLKRDAIHPLAKILALVDRYATLTGSGPTRTRGRAYDVIRDIVRSKNEEFSPALIKTLLAETSLFPPGTAIRLNSGEVGRVIGVNRHHPLRPRVGLTADGKGHPLPSPRLIDLSETPFLYITGLVSEAR